MKKTEYKPLSEVSLDLHKVEDRLEQIQDLLQRVQSKLSPQSPAAKRNLDRVFTRTNTQLLELSMTLTDMLHRGQLKACSSL